MQPRRRSRRAIARAPRTTRSHPRTPRCDHRVAVLLLPSELAPVHEPEARREALAQPVPVAPAHRVDVALNRAHGGRVVPAAAARLHPLEAREDGVAVVRVEDLDTPEEAAALLRHEAVRELEYDLVN